MALSSLLNSRDKLPRLPWRRSSIRQKLTILMLVIGLLPTIIVGAVGFVATSNELQAKSVDQLLGAASRQEQKINTLLQQRQEEVSTLANRFDLQTALGDYLAGSTLAARLSMDKILLDRKVGTPGVQSLTIVDLHGKVLASTIDGVEDTVLPADEYAVGSTGEATVSVREDQRDGINKLYIASKLNVNKMASGVMVSVFRMDDIVATVQDYTGLGSTGETVVAYKASGGDEVSIFPLRFNTDAALSQKLNSLNLFETATSTHRATDYRGNTVIVAPRPIVFANWAMATKIDIDEVLAPIAQLRTTFIITLILSSVAIILVALWLTGLFARPILYIAQIAERIGRGDLAAKVSLRRRDEIGVLGDSVNAMGKSLGDFVTNIESERNRLEIIINSTAESILAIDKHGIVLLANRAAAELTQLSKDQIVGKSIQDTFPWTRELRAFPIDYQRTGTNTYPSLQYTDHKGNTHFVRIVVARVSDEQQQKAAQTIVTIHDETKKRELEDMKVDFVSMAAHELRTPLASLRGYIELITYKESQRLSAEGNKYLNQALKSSSELGGLINNLLDVTRIERGTLALNLDKVDLATTIQQAIEDLHFSLEEKELRIKYDGAKNGCYVLADQIAIREVINNLLVNAVKYTPPHGQINISLRQDGDAFAVNVADTGVGIPQHALPYLFTKFYRVHGGLDSGSTGTGLGLFISKSIIERHNGTIDVESKEGVGSVFRFTLPVLDEVKYQASQINKQPNQTFIRRHRGWIAKDTTRRG